jgi:hypothetical protein
LLWFSFLFLLLAPFLFPPPYSFSFSYICLLLFFLVFLLAMFSCFSPCPSSSLSPCYLFFFSCVLGHSIWSKNKTWKNIVTCYKGWQLCFHARLQCNVEVGLEQQDLLQKHNKAWELFKSILF